MDIHIKRTRPAQPKEWDAIWRHCSYATYFHSREWAEIWSRYTQGKLRPNPLLMIFSDGKKALLALSCQKWEYAGASGKYFLSCANGNYGGWIAADSLGKEHAILMKEFLTQELGYLFWQINPFDDLVAETGVVATCQSEIHVINLEREFEEVYCGWSCACRNSERKARKSGVMVRVADTEEDWRDYYHAYEDSLRRWGERAKERYGWALFQEMFNRQSKYIKLWLATTKDELIVAGVLMCYSMTHAAPWHASMLENYGALRPNNRLYYEIIKDACDKRYRWFDFGTSPSEGVRRFKQTFGARPLDYIHVDISPEIWDIRRD